MRWTVEPGDHDLARREGGRVIGHGIGGDARVGVDVQEADIGHQVGVRRTGHGQPVSDFDHRRPVWPTATIMPGTTPLAGLLGRGNTQAAHTPGLEYIRSNEGMGWVTRCCAGRRDESLGQRPR